MYKQKKNEKSTKNKWKRSRSRMYGIGILIVTLCLTACEKEEHRMEEVLSLINISDPTRRVVIS